MTCCRLMMILGACRKSLDVCTLLAFSNGGSWRTAWLDTAMCTWGASR